MWIDFWQQLLLGGGGISALMVLLWFVQRRSGDAGIVDIGWSFGLGMMAPFIALTSGGEPLRRLILALIAATWAFRLGIHLVLRNRGRSEDGRYQSLRQQWGSRTQIYLFLFFQAQAALVVLFAVPYWIVARNPAPLSGWDLAGLLLFVVALLGESLADHQLERFRSQSRNRGKTCRQGLWRYSRHPNYFFEWLHWWSYVLLAAGAPLAWVTLGGPLLMLLFLFKVTGIPATEEQALKSRGEDYRRYQESTSAFFPWFPKQP